MCEERESEHAVVATVARARPRDRRLSLPREHGAWLALAGTIIVGLAGSGARPAAIGVALCVAIAFLARGPLEQLAVGRPARGDRAATFGLAAAAIAGALLSSRGNLGFGLVGAAIAVGGSATAAAARRARRHRDPIFEAAAMAALGLCALPIALAGDAKVGVALARALVLAAHVGVAVPLVRAELRRRERDLEGRAEAIAVIGVSGAALAVAALGAAPIALGLVPRLLFVMVRRAGALPSRKAAHVGARETVLLALVAAIVLAAG